MAGLLSDLLPQSMYGYKVRQPYDSENDYFKNNLNVAGMAAEDDRVVLNPYSNLNEAQKRAVIQNEAARIWMRQNQFAPPFYITPEQRGNFAGTVYGGNDSLLRQTLLARMLSGDSSAGSPTEEQQSYVNLLGGLLGNVK